MSSFCTAAAFWNRRLLKRFSESLRQKLRAPFCVANWFGDDVQDKEGELR
jgi:hypothetical protein